MSLTKFEIINTIVDTGSLTKAAESLGLTQSAVSHAVSSLESEWGFSIMNRDRSGIRLTSNGERLIKYIRTILQHNELLQQEVAAIHGLETGTIRIGTFTSVSTQWIPGIIKEFQSHYPSIQIKLLEGDHYDEIEQWLLDGSIDLGFLTKPSSKTLDFLPLKKDEIRCILPVNHRLCEKDFISYEDIKDEAFIMPKWGTHNDILRFITKNNQSLKVKYEVADDQAIISMVRHGLGITILPEMVLFNLLHGIKVMNMEGEYFRSIGLATPSLKKISPAAKRFIETVKTWLLQQNLLDY